MRALRNAGLVAGALIVGAAVAIALFAPLLVPHDPFAQDLSRRLIPPFWMEGARAGHPLGTDQLGRDYLSRLIYGARISMLIGIATTIASGLIGIALGVAGGFFGGRVDDAVLFAITARLSIPLILVALAVVSVVGSSLTVVVMTLGLLLWDRFAVVARVATMQVRNLAPAPVAGFGEHGFRLFRAVAFIQHVEDQAVKMRPVLEGIAQFATKGLRRCGHANLNCCVWTGLWPSPRPRG